jgi:hypothetical protein
VAMTCLMGARRAPQVSGMLFLPHVRQAAGTTPIGAHVRGGTVKPESRNLC